MISFLGGIISAAIIIYIAMIYGNTAIAVLGIFEIIWVFTAYILLFLSVINISTSLEIPIVMVQQNSTVRLCVKSNRKATFLCGRVIYNVKVKNIFTGKKSSRWISGNEDYLYEAGDAGCLEFSVAKIKIRDISGLFSIRLNYQSAFRIFLNFIKKKLHIRTFKFSKKNRGDANSKKHANLIQNVEVFPEICSVCVQISEPVRNFFGDADVYDDFRPGHDPSELFDVREFRNGDKIQSIHWKLSAKNEDLIVKENSLPKACAVVLLANYKKSKCDMNAYLKLFCGISFSLMDAKCPHYVAWYDMSRKDIVRARVDDEESFYIFLTHFITSRPADTIDAKLLYEEKYKAERIIHVLEIDTDLTIKRGTQIIGKANESTIESDMESLEILL